ncbi:MAG: gas vesicle protein [Planctomycetota bacterium]
MAVVRNSPTHQTDSTNVADLLERVLDKGVVIAGDIKVSLLDIELLTVQIRLVVCSIDKAKEMGMDWWANSPVFGNDTKAELKHQEEVKALTDRLASLESQLAATQSAPPVETGRAS